MRLRVGRHGRSVVSFGSASKRPSLAIVLGGKGHEEEGGEEPAPDEDDDVLGVSDDELEAAKTMREAKTDEEYAKALKAFIKICEGY